MNWEELLKPILISGKEVLPLIEGGKGIAATDGMCSGAWAAAGGVGTFSGVNAHIPGMEDLALLTSYPSKVRIKRHAEMIERAIKGGIAQARIAYETACHQGRIHMNVLWEMGDMEEILNGILSKVKGMIHGVTSGAGLPFRLAEICAKHNVKYYPIVSSTRAFNILWRRAYHRLSEWLGGVVYEDPWLAGGHNGLSTDEDETKREAPKPRLKSLRAYMRSVGISDRLPIFIAGGIWCLSEWTDCFDNPDLGTVAFQFGTRPLLTQESPIPLSWKKKLLTIKKGDVALNRFSPTGFPSSAVQNAFLKDLQARLERQIPFSRAATPLYVLPLKGKMGTFFLRPEDELRIQAWEKAGFSVPLETPSETLVFVTPAQYEEIKEDCALCVGCLSSCRFSGWNCDTTEPALAPDPRSFCIQKSLQAIVIQGETEQAIMFCGHEGYRFAQDPFYANGFIPTVKELVGRIRQGL
ncbi:2-nitropropane dioxygenase [Alphaproteobacteria bacterium]|nr:2-nitropropane dioxygenase [Alphaproteobacteria bacterium]GHS99145.1 2-nitropropane dioxygenase [Alphaproteobacteria bacterium]